MSSGVMNLLVTKSYWIGWGICLATIGIDIFSLSLVVLTGSIHNQQVVLLSAKIISNSFLAVLCGFGLMAIGYFTKAIYGEKGP